MIDCQTAVDHDRLSQILLVNDLANKTITVKI